MSHQAVSAVLAYSKAEGSDRLVLVILAHHADRDTFECYPGNRLLAKEAGMSERNLIRCIARLEESQELTVTKGNGRGHLSSYRINLERVTQLTPFKDEKGCQASQPLEEERVTPPPPITAERVTSGAERVTPRVIKGDKLVSAYKEVEQYKNNKETVEEKPMSSALDESVLVRQVFTYWQQRMNHPQAKLTAEREKKIRARLKQGYTVVQIQTAIDGCAGSPYHQGQNDNGTVYDDIELICRNGTKLESFISRRNGNGRTQVSHKETHNERAARETFELAAAAFEAPSGFDSPDTADTSAPWTAIDIGGF